MLKRTILLTILIFSNGIFLQRLSAQGPDSDSIIPPERRVAWNPGIPGGIPDVAGPTANILDYGADPAGNADSRAAIVSAISALPASGGVVLIPEGKFRVGSKITISRDHIVLRGTGWKSKLLLGADGEGIEISTYQRGSWQTPAGDVRKGDSMVVVQNGSLFTTGEFAEIEQDNDPDLMYTDPEWDQTWSENAVGQLFRIESVNGDTLTLETPVNLDFSSGLNLRIRPQNLVQYVGFEDLYLEKTVANGSTLLFKNAAFCWVRNVESYHTRRTHVEQATCLNNEIRDSYFHRSYSYGGGGSGYGVGCGFHVTNTLVENNIFDSLRHAMIIQLGANGNVYGYNYSIHPVQGDGETNLNAGWIPPDISIHGHYPFMNLFEGNELEEIGIGDYWGPAGPGNTYFRNRVNGEGIIYYDYSHRQNVVGNVTTVLRDNDNRALEKLEHGNVVSGTVQWDPAIVSMTLPSSYYLDTLPSFFGEQPWPPFGPDVSGDSKLPAQERFESFPTLNVWLDRNPVEQYRKLEFTLENGKTYVNPFDPEEVDISALFISPSQDTMKINAFWDGDWWRIRFAGAETGTWQYLITVNDTDDLLERKGSFQVITSDKKGWIGASPADPHYLIHDDGSPFFGVGMAVPWLVYDSRYYAQPGLFGRLEEHGVNLINWLFTSWDIQLLRDSYDTYSMADARKFDLLLTDAEIHGIKLVLGIWIHDLLRDDPHPWNGFYDWKSNPFNQLTGATGFFSDSLSWEYQQKYYRYLIARYGYSSSIAMWHTVAEINGTNAIYDPYAMQNDPRGWHNKINRFFQENDPFGHPTTVSGSGGYDFSEGWEITGIPQAHEYPYPPDRIVENTDRIAFWADRLHRSYMRPGMIGEFGKATYEAGISEHFLHNGIWAGVLSGACATPLHWWGGQISQQPENFSTFNETMMNSLRYLGEFVQGIDMASQGFIPLYGAPETERPSLANMTDGAVYVLKGDSLTLGWIHHVDENSTQQFQGVEVSIPGLRDGQYTIRFYDPWTGVWNAESIQADSEGGSLGFTCPDFTSDLAVKIAFSDSLGVAARALPSPAGITLYPNPCHDMLQIRVPDNTQSVRLLTLTGQVVEELSYPSSNLLRMDMTLHQRGVYLVQVRDREGLLTSSGVIKL